MSRVNIGKDLVVVTSRYMDNNSYLVFNKNEVIIIDPSFSGQEIIDNIPHDTKLVGILLTHAHFDHCYDTKQILDKWNCPVYVHEADKDTYFKYRYDDLTDMKVKDFAKNIKWFNSKQLKIGSFTIDVLHTPGHSKGSVIYRYKDYVFVGDTLFYNSYGRTDLGNSNPIEMIRSLDMLWNKLKDSDLILPGHNKWGLFKEIKQVNLMAKELIKK